MVGFGNHLRLISDFSQSGPEVMDRLKRFEHSSKHFPDMGRRKIGKRAQLSTTLFSIRSQKSLRVRAVGARCSFSAMEKTIPVHTMMTAIETAQASNVVVYTIRYTEKGTDTSPRATSTASA